MTHVDQTGMEKLTFLWRNIQSVFLKCIQQGFYFTQMIFPFAVNQTIIHDCYVVHFVW